MSEKETNKAVRIDVLKVIIEGVRQGYEDALKEDVKKAKAQNNPRIKEASEIINKCVNNALKNILDYATIHSQDFVIVKEEKDKNNGGQTT
jgi:hypothetical protein